MFVVGGEASIRAAMQATDKIPIIMALAKADDRNVPLMLSASERVQAQCLGV